MKIANVDISVAYIAGTEEQKNDGYCGKYLLQISKAGSSLYESLVEITEEEFADVSAQLDLSITELRES